MTTRRPERIGTHLRRLGLVLLGGTGIVGCGDPGPSYHADIRPIIEGRCLGCHQTGGIAPFPLDAYARVRTFGAAVRRAVESRRMPPWSATAADVHYRDNPSLTDQQIDTIRRWVQTDMPEGNASDFRGPLDEVGAAFAGADVDLTLPEPYQPTQFPDEYRCFPLRWPQAEERFVTALSVQPGNVEIVHHVAIFLVPPTSADLPFAWEQEDGRPGYSCFGGPSGGRAGTLPIGQLGAWLPGQSGNVYPDGIGIRVQPGSTVVVQMHYNILSETPQPDQSRIEFAIAAEVTKEAWYAPYLDLAWPLGQMPIPAGEPEVVHETRGDPRDFFDLVAGTDLPFDAGFEIHAVMFHMHTRGARGEVARLRRGFPTTFLRVDPWDFNWQRQYVLREPLPVIDGDALRLRCVFDGRRTATDVNWGEGTDDEMCVANLLVTAL